MTRLWREDAGPLLVLFLVLDIAILVYGQTAGARYNSHIDFAGQQVAWMAIDAFLVWRIWRGGRLAWGILLALSISR